MTAADTPDPSSALLFIYGACRYTYSEACIDELIDVDPNTPGQQYDCAVAAVSDDNLETRLGACDTSLDDSPCWRIRSDQICSLHHVDVRGFLWPDRPHLRGECLVH